MRIALGLVMALLLAPGIAGAGPRECDNLGRDIERFDSMADRASALGNPQWEDGMREHADLLEERRQERCSEADLVASTTECRDLTRRIEHYEELAARAEALGNPLWGETAREHIELLKEERQERCPEWSQAAQTNRAIMRMLKTAGSLALTYFTMGAF